MVADMRRSSEGKGRAPGKAEEIAAQRLRGERGCIEKVAGAPHRYKSWANPLCIKIRRRKSSRGRKKVNGRKLSIEPG